MLVRLQKVIAGSGLASRRQAEALIRQGKVVVNGAVVFKLGTCVDPQVDHIKVNGEHVGSTEPEVFILLHKPAGYLTTMKDPHGRPTVADLVDRVRLRVFPVGRLDHDAEGLLLLTNNGQVAQACLHPKYHVPKTYLVKVSKVLTEEELMHLRKGVQLDDGMTAPAVVKKSGKAQVNSWIEMTIYEGRTHQVKRMLEALGHRVLRLKRIRFGPLGLGDLLPGAMRFATDAEANALRAILQREPRREKLPAKIVRAPGSPIQRVKPHVPNQFPQPDSLRATRSGARKSFRTSPKKRTNPFQKENPVLGKGAAVHKPVRPGPASGSKGHRAKVEGSKNKRPSFPHGVAPKVVLKAFMDYEKQMLAERAARQPHSFQEKFKAQGQRSDTKPVPQSRMSKPSARAPRNSTGPRPASPNSSSRFTTRPRPAKSRSLKKSRG